MIFLTGGSGLLGGHVLLNLLSNGFEVKALKRSSTQLSAIQRLFERNDSLDLFDKTNWVDGDLNDPQFLEKEIAECETVIHCAAVVSFNSIDNQAMFQSNVIGTENLVNACLVNDVRRLIYISSTSAIGKQKAGITIDEKLFWEEGMKNSFYSFTKYRAELEVWRGAEEGLSTVILNPAVIIGPGEWGKSSTNIFITMWNGLKFFTSGSNAFVDVRDVARIVAIFINHPLKNERFLLFSENKSFKELFEYIADSLGKPKPSIKANRTMTALAWRGAWVWSKISGKPTGITRETAKSANSKQLYTNQKIKDALGIDFIPVKQSIADTAAIFLQERKK
ncbi:MAG: NAD-dependent epimerase/dehydratase family protein [Flavobacteriales bacterium]|nr:NAD-dependent epimerase/dehydratase family protein [Flavobacteriales bacterium]